MNWAILTAALALAPVTQQEAIEFHSSGQCQMMVPGTGLRSDGSGWILSMYPGKHVVYAVGGVIQVSGHASSLLLDMDVGRPYRIQVTPPSAPVYWCVPFAPYGRNRCGPVPPAFLYAARTVK